MLSCNIVGIYGKEHMVTERNVIYELKRLESRRCSQELSYRDKIETIIIKSCHSIVEWNFLLNLEKGYESWKYIQWKEELLQNFCDEELTFCNVFRMKRSKDQTLGDFIRDVERKRRRLKIAIKERIGIIKLGVSQDFIGLFAALYRTEVFDKKNIEILEDLEHNLLEEKIIGKSIDLKIKQAQILLKSLFV